MISCPLNLLVHIWDMGPGIQPLTNCTSCWMGRNIYIELYVLGGRKGKEKGMDTFESQGGNMRSMTGAECATAYGCSQPVLLLLSSKRLVRVAGLHKLQILDK